MLGIVAAVGAQAHDIVRKSSNVTGFRCMWSGMTCLSVPVMYRLMRCCMQFCTGYMSYLSLLSATRAHCDTIPTSKTTRSRRSLS